MGIEEYCVSSIFIALSYIPGVSGNHSNLYKYLNIKPSCHL